MVSYKFFFVVTPIICVHFSLDFSCIVDGYVANVEITEIPSEASFFNNFA